MGIMYYKEFEEIASELPDNYEDIEYLDNYLYSLTKYEKEQLDTEFLASILDISGIAVNNVFKKLVTKGYAKRKEFLYCQREECCFREFDRKNESLPITEECDLCNKDHTFRESDIVKRYEMLI